MEKIDKKQKQDKLYKYGQNILAALIHVWLDLPITLAPYVYQVQYPHGVLRDRIDY